MDPQATAIVLSYKRPKNIQKVVNRLLDSTLVSSVLVSNNNPDVDEKELCLPADPRVSLVTQPMHTPAAIRFSLAADMEGDRFIAVDDDMFLTGHQIDALLAHLIADPLVPHGGPWGQKLGRRIFRGEVLKGWYYPNSRVDVLNRVYAFSGTHARRFVEIMTLLGCPSPYSAGPWDDVVLSHCGEGLPATHDIGEWEACSSERDPGVALWMKPGFAESRMEILKQIRNQDKKKRW